MKNKNDELVDFIKDIMISGMHLKDESKFSDLVDKYMQQGVKLFCIHNDRLSFTSIDKAVNDLNLSKKVNWFVWQGELVRRGKMCSEAVIVNGQPVLINEA